MKTKTIKGNNILQLLGKVDENYKAKREEDGLDKLGQKEGCFILYETLKVNEDMSWSASAVCSSFEKACEWGFKVPPNEVDLDIIRFQLSRSSIEFGRFYINHMRKKAPQTYALLVKRCPNVKQYAREGE